MAMLLVLAACSGIATPTKRISSPTHSPPAVATASGATASAETQSFASLKPGDTRIVECGESAPQFNPSGDAMACGGAIYSWPEFERRATVRGTALGWGSIDGTDKLLLHDGAGTFSVADIGGHVTAIELKRGTGRTGAAWSPDRTEVWLETGIQTTTLGLVAWTPDGQRQIASVADPAQNYTNITASVDGAWVAVWGIGCATGGRAETQCHFRGAVGPADGSAMTSIGPDINAVSSGIEFDDGGTYHFVVQPGGPGVDVWSGSPGAVARPILLNVRVWPVAGGSLALADATELRRLNFATGAQRPIELRAGISPDKIISVSPGADWVVAFVGSGDETIRFGSLVAGQNAIEVSASGQEPSVLWSPAEDFAVLAEGPPFTTTVVRVFR
jgi:hypothetical protein